MSQLNNPMEIYKLLPKSNCRQCKLPTCLAFAASVINGQKSLGDCPHLDSNITERFDIKIHKRVTLEQQQDQILEQLRREIAKIDFYSSAERLGASLSGEKLKIKCLGKDFIIDSNGNITSDCHVITWLALPLLDYVLSCSGNNVTGEWVPFRELKNGMTWIPLFEPLCEKPLKQIADTHTELFEDILHLFGGRPALKNFSSDISLILYPLPRIPILICYCKPEDELESKINIFFDTTAEDNLNIRSIYGITAGLVRMFEKITLRHG
jgi:ribosomal protein S10